MVIAAEVIDAQMAAAVVVARTGRDVRVPVRGEDSAYATTRLYPHGLSPRGCVCRVPGGGTIDFRAEGCGEGDAK